MTSIRPATREDLPALRTLIPLSVRALSRPFYSHTQIESALLHVFGPDTQLIIDGTYFVAESDAEIVGCGGWSRRQTLYGGDQRKAAEDPRLDPETDAARIRAFFIHPDWARRGVGSQIMAACVDAARLEGFRRLELMATLPGEALYKAWGFIAEEQINTRLPDGVHIGFVRMTRDIDVSEGHPCQDKEKTR